MNLRHAIDTYRGHTIPHFRFTERRNVWFAFSAALLVLSLIGLFVRELDLSIDFQGGAQISFAVAEGSSITVEEVDAVLAGNGIDDAETQLVNEGQEVAIKTESLAGEGIDADVLLSELAAAGGIDRTEITVEDVGPTWGAEISRKALRGLLVVLLAIALYITLRFEWAMAIGALIALLHDVVITAGFYALVGREVTPETVIAILTILGFSLYDTVVIFDKIKENGDSPALVARLGYDGVIDLSLNQVLMRSVNTSLVVLLPILSLLLFGGETLKDFAFAMFIGTAIGAYSSIFVAAPALGILKRRDPRIRQAEERRATREGRVVGARSAASTAASGDAGAAVVDDAAAASATARTSSRPRPTSKRRPPAKRKRR